jgi:hypothetical protein
MILEPLCLVGSSGREVISLQEVNSLLLFECNGELIGFLRCRAQRDSVEKPSENRLVESGDASASYSFLVVCHTTV